MIQTIAKTVTFDEFIAWYPENSVHKYELHKGVIVEMPKPTGEHSELGGFLSFELTLLCRSNQLPYFLPKECVVKHQDDESGYEPDVIVLDREAVAANEPRWSKESVITMVSSIRLIIEIVSTNWRDDYFTKARDYEEFGIPEYWIVDYRGLGGRQFIGNPKQPTLSVCQLVEGEYQVKQFRGDDRIESLAFPDLQLTAEQIFRAGLPPGESN
jgi:Uma2 family endonuclease